MATKRELETTNLTLLASLNEALELLDENNISNDEVQELREVVKSHRKNSKFIYQQIQSDTIAALQFPVMLRKMWSGNEVQEWLQVTAKQIKP